MTRPTDQELQDELQDVVKKHNDAVKIQNQCKTRFTQIQAILQDRQEESKEESSEEPTT